MNLFIKTKLKGKPSYVRIFKYYLPYLVVLLKYLIFNFY